MSKSDAAMNKIDSAENTIMVGCVLNLSDKEICIYISILTLKTGGRSYKNNTRILIIKVL